MSQPKSSSVDVSVILICWNSLELTSEAVRSLIKFTKKTSLEILIIDNASTDDSATELKRRFPQLNVIAASENLGFAAGNNKALGIASGRHVLLLNSDTIQTENAVDKAVEYLDANLDVGVLGIMHRNDDATQSYQPSAYQFPKPWQNAMRVLLGAIRSRRLTVLSPVPLESDVDWVTGSFFLIRRECLQTVGFLDERFFVYAEDIDWCFRARKAGWKIRFWPDASFVHMGSSSASQVDDKTFMLYRNELEFFRKNKPGLGTFVFYLAMSFRLCLSTGFQLGKWIVGQANWLDVHRRWQRQRNFITLVPDRRGLATEDK